MKILFVLEHFYPYIGGAEKLFYVLTTKLIEEGYEVVVVTTHYDKKLPKTEDHKGVKIVRVNCYNRYAFTILSIRKILQHAKGADIIHTTTYNAALPAMIVGKLRKKPVFITFHEVWGDLWKSLPFTSVVEKYAFYYFEQIILKLPFKKFIAVSEFTRSKLIEHGIQDNKIERIYNGINYEGFKDYIHNPTVVFTYTYFGRLGISKGLDLLIPAAASVKKMYPLSKLKLIIPKQPKGIYTKVLDLISSYDLDDYIEFHHNLSRDDLYNELIRSSCVVIPSYSEGFCFAAAETVAMKIPLVTSDLGALKEVVSGKFIKMKTQNIEGLYEALEKAYLGHWSESAIHYFHFQDALQRYISLYKP